jgi:hypothetical protein
MTPGVAAEKSAAAQSGISINVAALAAAFFLLAFRVI